MNKKTLVIGTISIFLFLSIASVLSVTAIPIGRLSMKKSSFYPSDDATISAPDANDGSSIDLLVRNTYGYQGSSYWGWNTLIKFDSLVIPANAVILSAKLNLFYYKTWDSSPAGRTLNLHRVISDWSEDTVTYNTQPSYDAAVSANSIVPSAPGVWMSFDVTNDIINITDDGVNYGWKISDDNYWGKCDIPIVCFCSKEFGKYAPNLEISFKMQVDSNIMKIV
jgi:hypothetical protein